MPSSTSRPHTAAQICQPIARIMTEQRDKFSRSAPLSFILYLLSTLESLHSSCVDERG
jgi:hypothetical protein